MSLMKFNSMTHNGITHLLEMLDADGFWDMTRFGTLKRLQTRGWVIEWNL
ncbi:hypothetical protein J7J90_04805 [Candidatus Micrarchaeota archaeon]|nr:hypothetical protein [Candidatus Micrarchaeota archaeon]